MSKRYNYLKMSCYCCGNTEELFNDQMIKSWFSYKFKSSFCMKCYRSGFVHLLEQEKIFQPAHEKSVLELNLLDSMKLWESTREVFDCFERFEMMKIRVVLAENIMKYLIYHQKIVKNDSKMKKLQKIILSKADEFTRAPNVDETFVNTMVETIKAFEQ